MPSRALRPCAQPGCPALVTSGRCARHARPPARKVVDPWYSTYQWRQLRARVIAEEPVCRACGQAASTDADHIVPRRQAPDLALLRENLRGVCHACHSARTWTDTNRARRA